MISPGPTNDLSINPIGYNPASQMTSAVRTGDPYAWTGHYNVNRPYTSDGRNQYTAAGPASFTYDTRGNLTSDGTSSFTYSSENLLKTGPNATALVYDPALRLYQTQSGAHTTRFMYDGTDMIAEYDGSNALQRQFVFGTDVDQPVAWYEGIGTTQPRFFSSDERGSVISVTDYQGNLLAIDSYDEYGTPQSSTGGAGTLYGRFGYTGQPWLPELGLWYYKARIYSPTLGRFLQTDPIGYGDGLNWYAYVHNDPVDGIDLSGLQDCPTGRADATCSEPPINILGQPDYERTNCETSVCWIVTPDPIGSDRGHNEVASIFDLVKRFGPLKILDLFVSTPAGETPETLANLHAPRLNEHAEKRAARFGWTPADINRVFRAGPTGNSTNRSGDRLIVYGTPSEYLVVNTVTNDIVAVSHKGDPSFIPDSKIQWFR